MELAVNAVIAGEMGYKKTSDTFSVPYSTLERHVKNKWKNETSQIDKTAENIQILDYGAERDELHSLLD